MFIKKLICLVIFFICLGINCNPVLALFPNKTVKGNVESKRLESGTCLKLKLLTPLNTDELSIGQEFSSVLCDDIIVEKTLILPKGTLLRGTVSKISKKKRLSKSALLYLRFDHIVIPSGRQLPIKAGLCNNDNLSVDGAIDGGGNYLNEIKRNLNNTGTIMKKTANWGVNAGDNILYGFGKIITVPVGFFGAAVGGTGYLIGDSLIDLFRLGKPVILQQDDILYILLTRPLDVPSY